jgi:predicted small lipoprotein YifL
MKNPLFMNFILRILAVLLLMFLVLSFYGCGKKGNPKPPQAVSYQWNEPHKNAPCSSCLAYENGFYHKDKS